MQEMSKFTAFKYHTQPEDYTPKQLKAIEVIKSVAEDKRYNYHNYTIYGTSIEKLKKKKLYNQFTDDEIYWLCVEFWTISEFGMDKVNGSRDNQTSV